MKFPGRRRRAGLRPPEDEVPRDANVVTTASHGPEAMQQDFDRYAAAWASRDPDRLSALHSRDTVYWPRLDRPPIVGRDAVRTTFAKHFLRWTESGLETQRVRIGPGHWALDWSLTSIPVDSDTSRRLVRFDCLDVVVVDEAGLVERKQTFVDFPDLQQSLTPFETSRVVFGSGPSLWEELFDLFW